MGLVVFALVCGDPLFVFLVIPVSLFDHLFFGVLVVLAAVFGDPFLVDLGILAHIFGELFLVV